MKERSWFTGWLGKWRAPDDGPAPAPVDPAWSELRAQLATCLDRLAHIETQLQDSRLRSTAEEYQWRREAEELRSHLREARDGLADRDQRIEQLGARLQSQQEQLAAADAQSQRLLAEADANSQRLQAALSAEQQARHAQETAKAAAYREVRLGVTTAVLRAVPIDATVLVVSKGDDRLLELDGRHAWHFPRADDGKYVGYHPKDSESAIAHLEALRAKGAQYLVFPATAAWWLDHYTGFKQHLESRYASVPTTDDCCFIFHLGSAGSTGGMTLGDAGPCRELDEVVATFRSAFHRWPAILDWNSGLRVDGVRQHVFTPPVNGGKLPYLDGTVDVVLCGSSAGVLEEARRVASTVLLAVDGAALPNGDGGTARAPRVDIEWVTRRPSSGGDASIIIPCHNGAELTDACLTALTASLPPHFDGEIIVFDDASTDDTRELVKGWARRDPRIQVRWRKTNAGFVDACNQAAKAATRKFLVFLNNDTEPCHDWLTALLDTFRRFPKAGAAGGKLVLPDGTLQEAGGVIFEDGSAANFMRGETNLDLPLINYVREVDYCSGAVLATPRDVFAKLGGFDVRYRPAYYEDVDYCFKLRQAGYRVYYQPASKVIHREGGSCGTDVTRGVKRYQVRNQETFVAQWKGVLCRQPVRPADDNTSAWHALAERRVAESPQAQ